MQAKFQVESSCYKRQKFTKFYLKKAFSWKKREAAATTNKNSEKIIWESAILLTRNYENTVKNCDTTNT